MKKYLLALVMVAGIAVIALFTGCNCTSSSASPNNGDNQQTTSSTGVGVAGH